MERTERNNGLQMVKEILEANGIEIRETKIYGNTILHFNEADTNKALLAVFKAGSMNNYQKKAHETSDYPIGCIGNEHEAVLVNWIYPALGLSEEAGEVAGKFAKAVRDCNGKVDDTRKEEIVKELGDVLWFVSELCTSLGVSLSDVAQKNLDKLASRKERGVIHGSGDNR